jgi:hypothetical protein
MELNRSPAPPVLWELAMRKPGLVAVGAVIALAGLVFTLQGVGVLNGSSMSNTTFWSIAGPVIIVVGLVVVRFGSRRDTG